MKWILASVLLTSAIAQLTWKFTNNNEALCNDFTRAGFFLRREGDKYNEKKWLIFLESGSLCYSDETCNRRYFQSHVRDSYSRDGRGPFGEFNTTVAWKNTGLAGLPLAEFVNPLMRSPYCFKNETRYFEKSAEFSINGTDILSSDCTDNPTFCHHGHVLIPYCSSDVWLGNETYVSRDYMSTKKEPPCDCWDQECFEYNPTSKELQFTFRGQIIFKSVLQTLDEMYNLQEAEEIVLIGSSAGGIGVLNLVNWVRKEYSNVSIKVVIDSSWFINFRDSINQEFGSLNYNDKNSSMFGRLLDSHEACNDTRLGYPCCLSAQCILTQSNPATEEPYYPHTVPLFAVTSLYDIFLLANSLFNMISERSNQFIPAELAVQFISTVGEYGGAMNASVIETSIIVRSTLRFSYYATQCFQHIYFAALKNNLLVSETTAIIPHGLTFRHRVQPGVWNGHNLAYFEGRGYTIRDAINYWYHNGSEIDGGVVFRDQCYGPRCNDECPDELILQEQGAKNWSTGVKIGIAVLVVAIAVVSLLLKIYCCMLFRYLHWKQQTYLSSIDVQLPQDEERDNSTISKAKLKREFPYCPEDNAIAVACYNLNYYVNANSKIKSNDAEKSTHSPLTLSDLRPEDDLNGAGLCEEDSIVTVSPLLKVKIGLTKRKRILNNISSYFNPKELIAIMGPSGCGKTTFLDLLTGRRKSGTIVGDIFINGFNIQKNWNWYLSNTGYVLQLAVPYYEELTVRENLTLAAWVKLHAGTREKFERVEQVMDVTGLMDLADTVVGGATGPGLSGGQKRRLVVALQLLKLPSVVFLDEPTSGLDAASSTELLTHLNTLAASNRTVVLTIHQPRLEIFHMFHRIVVLSEGKIAYQGVPEKAYEVFVNALHSCYLQQKLVIPDLEDHNPADVIMDILGNQIMRKVVTNYYEASGEPTLVRKAVDKAQIRERAYIDGVDGYGTISSKFHTLKQAFKGSRQAGRTHNYSVVRLAALEARAMKRASVTNLLYLPIIFFGYGFLLGTVYFQQTEPFLILSGFCVYSVASALFMFPALWGYYLRTLQIYTFEHADGAGRASDLVIQPFVRFISMAIFPVVICAGVLYVLMVDYSRWDLWVLLQVVVVNVALNQVWTALLIWLILTFPQKAFRLSPVLSAVAGFTSGFFIPINQIPWWYRWMVYINPNYYGFSASAVLLLTHFESDCERDGGSEFECYAYSGQYVLERFSFDDINPYRNIVILMCMTVFFLLMAIVSNWMRFISLRRILVKINHVLIGDEEDLKHQPAQVQDEASDNENSDEETSSDVNDQEQYFENEIPVDALPSGSKLQENTHNQAYSKLELHHIQNSGTDEPTRENKKRPLNKRRSLYLRDGKMHSVWKPKSYSELKVTSKFQGAVKKVMKEKEDLHKRQQNLLNRVQATRDMLKEQKGELARLQDEEEDTTEENETQDEAVGGSDPSHAHTPAKQWQRVIKKVVDNNAVHNKNNPTKKKPWQFHDVVSQYMLAVSKSRDGHQAQRSAQELIRAPSSPCLPASSGVVPLRQWKSMMVKSRQKQMKLSSKISAVFPPVAEENEEGANGSISCTRTDETVL